MHFMKSVIRVSHQKAQKCTYGANSIKLNAFYYSINLIRNHISVTTKKHAFTVIVSWAALAVIWKSYVTERMYERQGWRDGQM